MKKITAGIVLFLLAVSICNAKFLDPKSVEKVRQKISAILRSSQTVNIAVVATLTGESIEPGTDFNAKRKYEYDICEMLLNNFSKYPDFKLVERADLDRVLTELNLTYTGLLEKEGSMEAGRILGVNYILFMEVHPISDSADPEHSPPTWYNCFYKLIYLEQGQIILQCQKHWNDYN